MEQTAHDTHGKSGADAQYHISQLADCMVCQQFFHIFLDQRHRHCQYNGEGAQDHHGDAHGGAVFKDKQFRHDTGCQINTQDFFHRAGETHQKSSGRVFCCLGNPAVERHTAAFCQCTQQDTNKSDDVVAGKRKGVDLAHVTRAGG